MSGTANPFARLFPPEEAPRLRGYLVEFDTVDQVLAAARRMRDAGYRDWDVHSPFPVHGLDGAMGVRGTRLPFVVLAGAATGALGAFLLQTWMNGIDYRYIVSGKPFISLAPDIPIMFEITVLFSAFAAFFGMLGMNRLPELHHWTFGSERFRRATIDRFFVSLEATDPAFREEEAARFLRGLGGTHLERVED